MTKFSLLSRGMKDPINPQYPDISFLREKAQKRIPRFAFEYLDHGCNSDVNLYRNTAEIRDVKLKPYYLRDFKSSTLETELFGNTYSAPFGVSPIGLQGMMWPGATEILAKAAFEHNLPFILSTVGTANLEKVSTITEGKAWFQLYHPAEEKLRNDLIKRAQTAQYQVLVILADTPAFGYRPREIKNGLSLPPRMTMKNIWQIITHPNWSLQTLKVGTPFFETLRPYIPKRTSLKHLGQFMNKTFDGRLSEERLKAMRDLWPGKLVLKGVASEEDVAKCLSIGLDGVIVSNHGGRQLDHGESAVQVVQDISKSHSGKITIMMDSGIRTGPDIASCLAAGAEFTFLGRSFMYGVSALGKEGGNHTMSLLKKQLQQVMEQLGCEKVVDLGNHRVM